MFAKDMYKSVYLFATPETIILSVGPQTDQDQLMQLFGTRDFKEISQKSSITRLEDEKTNNLL